MKYRRSVCLFVAAAVLLLTGSAAAQNPSTQKIHVLTLLGRPLAVAIAQSHGIFAKYGLEVDTENLPNSEALRGYLASGKGDIAYLAVDNAVAMVELVGADVIIVMGGEGSQNELIAQPVIKSAKDLRGKTLLVDAPNTAYALQLKKILLLSGMQVGRDYSIKPLGATPQRLIAMREHKEYAGSMLGPPTSILAKREGFVSLGSVPDLIGPYQAAGHFTLRKWAQEHPAALVSYLAAVIEGQRWLMVAETLTQGTGGGVDQLRVVDRVDVVVEDGSIRHIQVTRGHPCTADRRRGCGRSLARPGGWRIRAGGR